MKLKLSGVSIKDLSKRKKILLIVFTLLFLILVGSGAYLLWRVSQPETIAPEDLEAVDYNIRIFQSSDTFVLEYDASIQYLVIGGGAGGGCCRGGGGGAGGFITGTTSQTAGSYPVVVGGGGAAGLRNPWQEITSRGGTGGNSSVFGVVASGGGGGASGHNVETIRDALSGGSGGGGGPNRSGASGISGQGNSGGKGVYYDYLSSGGGGGGAGGTSTNFPNVYSSLVSGLGIEVNAWVHSEVGGIGGNGGYGKSSAITGSTVWYAGGGAGSPNRAGWAYAFGGGHVNYRPSGQSDNAGGGGYEGLNGINGKGGGGGAGGDNENGGSGGAGIVILKYAKIEEPPPPPEDPNPICGSYDGQQYTYDVLVWSEGGSFCSVGNSNPSLDGILFPTAGGSTSWECVSGSKNVTCSASREDGPQPSCGLRARNYPYTATNWPEGAEFCSTGTLKETSSTVLFPSPEQEVIWHCQSDGATIEVECIASKAGASCGDTICDGEENAQNCPEDCPTVCGDDFCTHDENANTCPQDCLAVCGDGFCTHDENAETCPQDCPAQCGDGFCDPETENAANCPQDCSAVCGDDFCTHDENANTCPQDCLAVCGDGFCTHDESSENCPEDCGYPTVVQTPSEGTTVVYQTVETIPNTGILDNVEKPVILGVILLFLGFTWSLIGKGIYATVNFLTYIPKKIGKSIQESKENRRVKKRYNEMRKDYQRKKKFEKKVGKRI